MATGPVVYRDDSIRAQFLDFFSILQVYYITKYFYSQWTTFVNNLLRITQRGNNKIHFQLKKRFELAPILWVGFINDKIYSKGF